MPALDEVTVTILPSCRTGEIKETFAVTGFCLKKAKRKN